MQYRYLRKAVWKLIQNTRNSLPLMNTQKLKLQLMLFTYFSTQFNILKKIFFGNKESESHIPNLMHCKNIIWGKNVPAGYNKLKKQCLRPPNTDRKRSFLNFVRNISKPIFFQALVKNENSESKTPQNKEEPQGLNYPSMRERKAKNSAAPKMLLYPKVNLYWLKPPSEWVMWCKIKKRTKFSSVMKFW